jgi:hypothetical protein
MKMALVGSLLAATGMMLSGCIYVGVERKAGSPDVVIVPQGTADSATFAEIDAAGKLDFDNARASALNTIAGRTNLSCSAQVHLQDTVFRRLNFENQKMDVFRTLIHNPSFCNPAKQNLLVNLNKLSFDNNRAEILRLINERGTLKD